MSPGLWNRRPLRELTTKVGSGATPRGGKNSYRSSGIPLIRSMNVHDLTFTWEDLAFINENQARELANVALQRHDVLLNITGASVARCCLLPDTLTSGRVNQHVAIIRANPELADPRFIAYYLTGPEGKRRLLSLAQGGATREALTKSMIEEFEVPWPPLPEQRRIAGILSAYDDLIENNRRRIKILEEMARALYREWFVHFRYPGSRPEDWEELPMAELLSSMSGGDWGADTLTIDETEEVHVIRGTDFTEIFSGGDIRSPVRFIRPGSFAARSLRSGDVVIENSVNAKTRSVGTTLLVDEHVLARLVRPAIAASFCKVMRPVEPALAPLIHLHTRHLREDATMEFYQNVAANGIANFQAKRFASEVRLSLPRNPCLRAEILAALAAPLSFASLLASQCHNLRRTRDLVLPRLISGVTGE